MNTTTDSQVGSTLQPMEEKVILARQALDELALQLSLGKAEARDKFEEVKKEFSAKLIELRSMLQAEAQQKAIVDLLSKIVELETALLTGKVDSPRAFNVQRRTLVAITEKVEAAIGNKLSRVPALSEFIHEIEILRLKLEILRLKFTVKKFKIKNSFHKGMDKAVDIVRAAESKVKKTAGRYREFREDVKQVYHQMQKAIRNL